MASASRLPSADGASPAMAQWFAVKAEHPDALVFFRMGDFYELFFADAEAASAALDIALTHRGEHAGAPIPMCGVPVHAADAYLARLIRRGFRVAIAEQMENPRRAPARGRSGVRWSGSITPGTLTEDTLLDARRPNLLVALAADRAEVGAAWLDVSTGLFETDDACRRPSCPPCSGVSIRRRSWRPRTAALGDFAARRAPPARPPRPLAARRRVAEAFGAASLDAFGTFTDAEAMAGGARAGLRPRRRSGRPAPAGAPVPRGGAGTLAMDAATRASLEILRARDGGSAHTLLGGRGPHADAPPGRGCSPTGWLLRSPMRSPSPSGRTPGRGCWRTPDAAGRLRAVAARRARHGARAGAAFARARDAARPRRLARRACGRPAAAPLLEPVLPTLLADARAALGHRARTGASAGRGPRRPGAGAARGWRRDPAGLRRRAGCRAGVARRQPARAWHAAARLRRSAMASPA